VFRVIDYETQNHSWYGQKASMHNPENFVVEAGWLDVGQGTPVQSHRSNTLEEAADTSWFNLDGVTCIVAHNAAYEIHVLYTRYKDEFLKFLKRGGRIFCTQFAEYLLSDFQWHYPPLNEVAPKYGGTQKVDGIKLLWEQGILTADIDPDLLHEYLAGPEGDVINTYKTFTGQYKLLQERGQLDLFWERMEGNLAFAMCENTGLYVDREVAERNMRERQDELQALQAEMQQYLPSNLPESFEFNWGNRWDLSAFLYGGARPYPVKVSYDPVQYIKFDAYQLPDGSYVPVQDVDLSCTEVVHYTRGKNAGLPKVFRVDSETEKLKNAEELWYFEPQIPFDSMQPVLREKFEKEWKGSQYLRCGTPVYSCSGEVLEALAVHGWEAARTLAKIQEVEKDLGSFYLVEEFNAVGEVTKQSGMMQYIQPDGMVYHQLNTCATVTGRLSASKPNTQQMPRADEDDSGQAKSKVKEMFVSRFGKDGCILSSDYAALEVVMLAAMSNDTALLTHMQSGTDMHCLRLSGVLQEPYEEVLKKCKDRSHPEHARYAVMRTDIKPRAFAFQYGASARGISFATGCTVQEAEDFIRAESALFPQTLAFREVVRESVERTGETEGGLQREQDPVTGRWILYRRGYYRAPSSQRYSFRQYNQWNSELKRETMQYRPTQMANYWCQGESFLVMAIAMGRILRWLLANDFMQGKACLINNVHDAAYLDVHKSVAAEVGAAVKSIMETTPKYMDERLGTNIGHVPFPAECVWGNSMQEEFPLKELNK
jgi:DNA polymerase I-like protein with 3'-5' exonuclease and polymerase domains